MNLLIGKQGISIILNINDINKQSPLREGALKFIQSRLAASLAKKAVNFEKVLQSEKPESPI